jgi:hypothetical protein
VIRVAAVAFEIEIAAVAALIIKMKWRTIPSPHSRCAKLVPLLRTPARLYRQSVIEFILDSSIEIWAILSRQGDEFWRVRPWRSYQWLSSDIRN